MKRENKERLAEIVKAENGITLDLDSIFDVQVKRIHEYKRQLLDVLRVAAEYLRMKEDRSYRPHPRSYLFGGKAAPGYAMAKLIIKLVNSVADVVNRDVDLQGQHHRGLPAQLPGVARRADLPGRRRLRADLHRRQGGVRHRQHEVRAQRRAHHRHARRRERRDPRGGRAGELLPLRPHRRAGRGAEAARATTRGSGTGTTGGSRASSTPSPAACSRRASRGSSGRSSTRSSTAATPTSSSPTSPPTSARRRRSSRPTSTRTAGPAWPS